MCGLTSQQWVSAVPGDVVDIQISRKKKGMAEGHAVRFHEHSPNKVQPFCSHFEFCGGCSWQNIGYEKQLFFKQKMVADALARIAKVAHPPIMPIIGSAKTREYRNRLDFAFSAKRWLSPSDMAAGIGMGEPGLGFHVSGRFDKVLDLDHCYLQEEPSNKIRLAIRDYAIAHGYPFFDLKAQTGSLRSLIVRNSLAGDLMLILVFYKESPERVNHIMEFVRASFPEISSLYYVMNPKANDTLYDLEHQLYSGNSYIREKTGKLVLKAGPKSFFQTNSLQANILYQAVLELAGLKPTDTVYDLYTGVGSIALLAAGHCQKVTGIETVPEAIEYAKQNALDNGIANSSFFAGDVQHLLDDVFIAEHGKPDVIITDPPRNGMDLPVVKKLLEILPDKIIYISCNPATQARDLEVLKSHYQITAVQPVDMFPQTWHVENIVRLERGDL